MKGLTIYCLIVLTLSSFSGVLAALSMLDHMGLKILMFPPWLFMIIWVWKKSLQE